MSTPYHVAMLAKDLDYDLPPDLIATTAAEPRDNARLMVVDRETGKVSHRRVADLPNLGIFRAGDLMLVNRSKVLPAYYECVRSGTGGKIKGLFIGIDASCRWRTMLESRGKLEPGELIDLDQHNQLKLIEHLGGGEWLAEFCGDDDTLSLLERIGKVPLPPYIRRARKALQQSEVNDTDMSRYNTVYAQDAGSVAAPTAGLHFTPQLLKTLQNMGIQRAEVTLHVGLGTFMPIRCDDVNAHPIHSESISIPLSAVDAIKRARSLGNAITAVGTTTVRAIESLPADLGAVLASGYQTSTDLYITPDNGFEFRFTDRLMTNFHLPRSTLLALVAALPGVGIDRLLGWYREAIKEGYRFYSYGDAMLIV